MSTILGGMGIFLVGMILMTDGLKALAGETLRRVLARFTGRPITALLSGVGVTALVQSSTATTVATIGFVSAGLLTLPQAVGVVFGANLGSTGTGWIVSQLGLKVSMGTVTLPLIGAGALMKLLGRARAAHVGAALAGFGLIFVGLDVIQLGMKDFSRIVDLSRFSSESILGRLVLVVIGTVMVLIVQSSAATVAATMAAVHSGALGLEQAAALVIGQNVGTTGTAAFAAIGASVTARRAALGHVLFNVVAAVVAFFALPLLLPAVRGTCARLGDDSPTTTIAAFHTAFNLLGVAILFPVITPFTALLIRLVPERGARLTRHLGPLTASAGPVGLEAARRALLDATAVALEALREALARDGRVVSPGALAEVAEALAETRRFLSLVRTAENTPAEHARHVSTLHALDHLERLVEACGEDANAARLGREGEPGRLALELSHAIETALPWLRGATKEAPSLEETSRAIADSRRAQRQTVLRRTAAGDLDPEQALATLEVVRWIDRLAYHAWRSLHHLREDLGAGSESVHEEVASDPAATP